MKQQSKPARPRAPRTVDVDALARVSGGGTDPVPWKGDVAAADIGSGPTPWLTD